MGNRSFLYLGTRDQIDGGDGRPFADANNSFPTLWRLLLAESELTPPNDHQRVFGDAGTKNLSARAAGAIARLRHLADGIRHHPLSESQPYLDLHFEALLAHCEAEIATIAPASPDDVWFSANIDELSWLDGDPPDDFVEKERQTCNAIAEGVRTALEARSFPTVDHLLEIDSYGATFADWRSWAWNFGFGGIDHPYFAMRDEPQTIPFADFAVDDESEDESDSWLGNGLERIRENGRVGVLQTAEVRGMRTRKIASTVLIPAEWDAIDHAGHPKLPLFWVTRDARVGLLRADASGAALLHACDLTDRWNFERVGTRHIAIVKIGDDLGLLGDDGRWIADPATITPPVTDLWDFTGEYAIATAGERQGVLSAAGTWTVAPTYVSIDDLQESGIAIAHDGSTSRLIDVSMGEFRSPPQAALAWLPWPGVFEGRQQERGTRGWWRADGRALIATQWDQLELLQEKPWLVRVERDGRSGVHDRNDRERIAPVWDSIVSRNAGETEVIPGHLEELIVSRDGQYGLIDGTGRELIPVQYDRIDNIHPSWDEDGGTRVHGALLQVWRSTPEGERVGAWDLDLRREIVSPDCDHLFAITLYGKGKSAVLGFLAVRHAPGDRRGDREPLRVGVLHADGRVLHELQYAWIAERNHVTNYADAMLVARSIARQWSAGKPVQAALATQDVYVWLHRDGRVDDDLAARVAQFRSGDFLAAHAIACQYRDGEGVPRDEALSQRWMLLAAGQPESVFDAPAPGMFKRLLGTKPPSPLIPASPDPRGDVQAMCDLAQALINGSQDPDELIAARAWMEIAVTRGHDRSRGNAEAHMLLGYLYLEGIGGPQDEKRALELSTRAAALGNTAASFNVGLMHEHGRGTKIDPERAIRHYTTASNAGDRGADLHAARLLLAYPVDESAASAKRLYQAVYHLQRAIDCVSADIAAAAQGELGELYWSGTGVEQDRDRALALLREAAEAGDERAATFLAMVSPDES